MPTTETRKMVLAAAAVCEDKKAENTRVLELDPADSGFTDFFLITSGTNTRQTVAIADDIELKMKRDFGAYANSVEGRRAGEWILMDYVDFVVHIFVEEKRAFYDIERLRKSARSVDLDQLKSELTKKTAAARKAHPLPAAPAPLAAAIEGKAAPDDVAAPQGRQPSYTGKKAAAPRKTAAGKAAAKTPALGRAAANKRSAAKKTPAKKSATRIAAASQATGRSTTTKAAAAKSSKPKQAARKPGK